MPDPKFIKGEKISYQDDTGEVNFIGDDYVSEWDDWEGVNISLLFDIHKACLFNKREYAGSITLNGV